MDGQAVGQLDTGGVVGGLLQLSLHAVECGDLGKLPAQRLLAGKAHGKEHKAIAGHANCLFLTGCTTTDFDDVNHAHFRKQKAADHLVMARLLRLLCLATKPRSRLRA